MAGTWTSESGYDIQSINDKDQLFLSWRMAAVDCRMSDI